MPPQLQGGIYRDLCSGLFDGPSSSLFLRRHASAPGICRTTHGVRRFHLLSDEDCFVIRGTLLYILISAIQFVVPNESFHRAEDSMCCVLRLFHVVNRSHTTQHLVGSEVNFRSLRTGRDIDIAGVLISNESSLLCTATAV